MHSKFDELGRFADPSVLILTSLADGDKHGYAIMTDIAEFAQVSLEPGTLYGALARLERQGWVEPLTVAGRTVLAQQLASMREIARVGHRRIAPA